MKEILYKYCLGVQSLHNLTFAYQKVEGRNKVLLLQQTMMHSITEKDSLMLENISLE